MTRVARACYGASDPSFITQHFRFLRVLRASVVNDGLLQQTKLAQLLDGAKLDAGHAE